MNARLHFYVAPLFTCLCLSQAEAQSCVHLHEPLWAYPNGMIAYFAFRTEGLCGQGCAAPTPVYHIDVPGYLSELAHDCEQGQGLQHASIRLRKKRAYVSYDTDREDTTSFGLKRPVDADYDFFTTWNAEYAPKAMRPNGEIRHCTSCLGGSNYVLVCPGGTEKINIRVFEIAVTRKGQDPRTYYVAYEREDGPSDGDLQADLLLQQDGPVLSYRFRLAEGASPYPDADWILLVRVERQATET